MWKILRRLLRFALRVLSRFRQHKGLMLASAVAFNALLSLVPLLGLVLVIMSHLVDPQAVTSIVNRTVAATVPQAAPQITEAIAAFLEQRVLASVVGAAVVLFFSGMAFRTLDDALSTIFETTRPPQRLAALRALALPMLLMGAVIVALVLLSLLLTAVDMLPEHTFRMLGVELSLASASRRLISLLGFVGWAALLAAFYRLMPEANVRLRHAIVGGLVAAVLWEGMRNTLAWYFANVSLVGYIYGSLTTVIVLLLTFEVGAIILLLGGQVIAEIVRCSDAGLRWYQNPDQLGEIEPTSEAPEAGDDHN